MKLLWIFLVFLIQSEFGDCWKCYFYDWNGYTCEIHSTSNVKEEHEDGKTDDDAKKIEFYGNRSENLTEGFGSLCERFKNADWIKIRGIKSVSEDLFRRCMNLKKILIVESEIEEVPENLFSNLTKLTQINLIENKLKSWPEKIFSNQRNLEWLNLDENQISCLPSNIFDSLTMLKALSLGFNEIQSLDPKWFENLHSLEGLELSNNNLQDLPKNIFSNLTKLEILDLSNNQLTTIHSDSFATQGNLEILSLWRNKISSIDEKILNLKKLNEVDMGWGNVCGEEKIKPKTRLKGILQKCFDNYQPRVDPNVKVISAYSCEVYNQDFLRLELIRVEVYSFNGKFKTIKCGTFVGQKALIHRGNVTTPNEYPWNAALVSYEGNLFCGGTVVSSRHVVTAAHCIKGKKNEYEFNKCDFYVQLGVHNFTEKWEEGRNGMAVKSIFIHPDWNVDVEIYEADIAVLELLNEIPFSKYIRPICLPDVDSPVANSTRGTAVGFGITENGRISDVLKKLQIPIYDYKNCTKYSPDHRYLAGPRSFCGGWADGSGVCTGDSGGGVYVPYRKAYYLRGVVSSSLPDIIGQCDVDREAVFTDVPKFYGWIKSGGRNVHALNRRTSRRRGH